MVYTGVQTNELNLLMCGWKISTNVLCKEQSELCKVSLRIIPSFFNIYYDFNN